MAPGVGQYRKKLIVLPRIGQTRGTDGARFSLPDGMPMPPGTDLYLPDGRVIPGEFFYHVGEEKGIDVQIALDLVGMARLARYEVAVIFSQDQDLSGAVNEVKRIAKEQRRWIDVFSAFPISSQSTHRNPIGGTSAIEIDRAAYDACIDPRVYRPRS
jgi:hypothetical protein